jgi:hypothetical protein
MLFVPRFVPGQELAKTFYEEVVAQLLDETPHSAALLDSTDVTSKPGAFPHVAAPYEAWAEVTN